MTSLLQLLPLAALSAAVGVVWGLSELVSAFVLDTRYALRTSGAWLLLIVNALVPAFVYILAASSIPELGTWQAAVVIGVAWPVVIRNLKFKFSAGTAAASDGSNAVDQDSVHFERIYNNFQSLAYRMINAEIAHQRAKLITNAMTNCNLNDLAAHARRLCHSQPLPNVQGKKGDIRGEKSNLEDKQGDIQGKKVNAEDEQCENDSCCYIEEIMENNKIDDDAKKIRLSSWVIQNFGREALEEFIQQQKRKVQKSVPNAAR